MKKIGNDICFFCVFVTVIVVYIVYFCAEHNESSTTSMKNRTLETDGFAVFKYEDFENIGKNPPAQFTEPVLKRLGADYQFVDYSYAIKNATLSTFHRDVTSSRYIYNSKHPVYTLILYKYEGCLLSLCPGSNYSYPFVYSQIVNISGPAGTYFLFHCDLLHAGCFNHCKARDIIQYKILHKEDVQNYQHLHNVHTEKQENTCEDTFYNNFLRKCSYFFELPINTVFSPILQKKEEGGIVGKLQDYSSIGFYNNI